MSDDGYEPPTELCRRCGGSGYEGPHDPAHYCPACDGTGWDHQLDRNDDASPAV